MLTGKRLAFIGGGNMAEALLKGFLAARLFPPESLGVSDVREDRLALLARSYGVRTTLDNGTAAREADILILAVKPQVIHPVVEGLRTAVSPTTLLVSIAAGVSTAALEAHFSHPTRVVRVMPNTPALVLEGASALAPGRHANEEDVALVQRLFNAVGAAVVVAESLMDAVTGLSGSGPAYVFVMIEALADAGVRAGLAREVAQALAAQTLRGAARMVLETGMHPGALKDMVASPAGTTIAGLHALERGGLRGVLMDAVEAAARRSRELGSM
jgi:pyrroline-5-carboxylate reductase